MRPGDGRAPPQQHPQSRDCTRPLHTHSRPTSPDGYTQPTVLSYTSNTRSPRAHMQAVPKCTHLSTRVTRSSPYGSPHPGHTSPPYMHTTPSGFRTYTAPKYKHIWEPTSNPRVPREHICPQVYRQHLRSPSCTYTNSTQRHTRLCTHMSHRARCKSPHIHIACSKYISLVSTPRASLYRKRTTPFKQPLGPGPGRHRGT